jgi:hypothetical protein
MDRISNQYVTARVEQLAQLFQKDLHDKFTRIAEREMRDELVLNSNCESVLARLLERDTRAISDISACILSKYVELPSYVDRHGFEAYINGQVRLAYLEYLDEPVDDSDPDAPESSCIYLCNLAQILTVPHPGSYLECQEWDLVFYLDKGKWKCRADEPEDEDKD